MKKFCTIFAIILCCQLASIAVGKVQTTALIPNINYLAVDSTANKANYTFFTPRKKVADSVWKSKNANYLHHPDAMLTDKYAPTDGAVELMAKRTEYSKQYVDKNSDAKFYILKSTAPIHYLKGGQWLTIDERIEPVGNQKFEAPCQKEPVGFDMNSQKAYVKMLQGIVYFNQWTLWGGQRGSRQLLAKADWSKYTAGDDGIFVTDIFPGIDAEMKVDRGAIKTSFIIHKNNFDGKEQLIFADKFQDSAATGGFTTLIKNEGVDYEINSKNVLHVDKAESYLRDDKQKTAVNWPYSISKDTLLLPVLTSYVDSQLVKGPIVIDPLVTSTNTLDSSKITGSKDCGSYDDACEYELQVPSPAGATITGIFFKYGFETNGIAKLKDGYWGIASGACEVYYGADPSSLWYNSAGSVSTMGKYSDITEDLLDCMPSPTCTAQNIPFTLKFFNDICSGTSTCSNKYIKAEEPFVILINGYTLALDSITSGQSICSGNSVTLSAAGKQGVAPYSYVWADGSTDSSITITPSETTTYQVTISDQCNNSVSGEVPITVRPTSNTLTTITACASFTWNNTTYTSSGVYTVHSTNSVGCDSSSTLDLTILSTCPDVIVPSVFTPNGDGINDFLEIENLSSYTQSMVDIYDRYGRRVAHYAGTDRGWDGYYLGHSEPSADYWYVISLPELGKHLAGHFSLKR